MDFGNIERTWRDGMQEDRRLLQADLAAGGWFSACRNAVEKGDVRTIESWLSAADGDKAEIVSFGGRDELALAARAHLLCALSAIGRRDPPLDAEAAQTGFPSGFLRDLTALLSGRSLSGVHEVAISALFVDDRAVQPGVVCRLTLESVPDGDGSLYPHPGMAFVLLDDDFRLSLSNAHDCVRRKLLLDPDSCDVRWRLHRADGKPLPPALVGNSAGGAFALGLARLLALGPQAGGDSYGPGLDGWPEMRPRTLRNLHELDLSGLAITASVGLDGRLHRVDGPVFEKLLAAARERSVPRIHTVVVSEGQRDDIEAIDPSLLDDDPHAGFLVIRDKSLDGALERLALDTGRRWRDIVDSRPVLESFVGRQWLAAKVDSVINSTGSGYIVLVGGPGIGKSAFAAHRVLTAGEPVVSHFIKRDQGNWADPDVILRSLIAQLRRKYALPASETDDRMSPGAIFVNTLQRVSYGLGEGEKEVIYLDGLDEAFGCTGCSGQGALPGMLPKSLPQGIVFVLTSRPGEHLKWLANSRQIRIESRSSNNQEDIGSYIVEESSRRSLGICRDLEEHLVKASEGCFAAAVLYLRDRSDLHADLKTWGAHPDQIPRGLSGWLIEEWETMLFAAARAGVEQRAVKMILGLLAVARSPLSRDDLEVYMRRALSGGLAAEPGLLPPGAGIGLLLEHVETVLGLAQGVFDSPDPHAGSAACCRFFHSMFPELIADEKLTKAEREFCHRLLAEACSDWSNLEGTAGEYARRNVVHHMLACGQIAEASALLSDTQFVGAKCSDGTVSELVFDIAALSATGADLSNVCGALVKAMSDQDEEAHGFWLQLRSALNREFGRYDGWPEPLRHRLEENRDPGIMLFLGETHDMARDFHRAHSVFGTMVQITSRDDLKAYCTSRVKLATVLDHRDRAVEGLPMLNALLRLPGLKRALPENYYWWIRYQKGISLRRIGSGRYDEASREFEAVRKAMPGKGLAASALHQLGVVDLAKRDLGEAERKFLSGIEERKSTGGYAWNYRIAYDYHRLGEVYDLTNRPEDAVSCYRDAIRISAECGNMRYVAEVVATYLSLRNPEVVELAAVASVLATDEDQVAAAFRHLSSEAREYLPQLAPGSGEQTKLAVRWDVAHEKGAWHPTVHVLIADTAGNIAVQKRGERDAYGKWDVSASGHVLVGEDAVTAALRETEEELGLVLNAANLREILEGYSLCKEGSPRVKHDRHKSHSCYTYNTDKTNRERTSLFLAVIPDSAKRSVRVGPGRHALAVKWMRVSDAVTQAAAKPGMYASAFKQLFGHPRVASRVLLEIEARLGP